MRRCRRNESALLAFSPLNDPRLAGQPVSADWCSDIVVTNRTCWPLKHLMTPTLTWLFQPTPPRSPQESATSPRPERPRNRPTLCTEHRPKLIRTVRLRIAPSQRSTRTIRHIALKNVPYRRKTTCCSLEASRQVLAETRSSPNQVAGTVQG